MAKLRVLGENPPHPRGNGENQLRELRDYLTRMKDELEFLLTHLGEDNLDGGLTEYLRRIREQSGQISGIQEKITDIEGEISDIDTALSGKQDTLTFDDAPTASSSNPVKSGGVHTGLQRKADRNLLRNWYFPGGGTGAGVFPVNTRGQASYTGGYCCDGWYGRGSLPDGRRSTDHRDGGDPAGIHPVRRLPGGAGRQKGHRVHPAGWLDVYQRRRRFSQIRPFRGRPGLSMDA